MIKSSFLCVVVVKCLLYCIYLCCTYLLTSGERVFQEVYRDGNESSIWWCSERRDEERSIFRVLNERYFEYTTKFIYLIVNLWAIVSEEEENNHRPFWSITNGACTIKWERSKVFEKGRSLQLFTYHLLSLNLSIESSLLRADWLKWPPSDYDWEKQSNSVSTCCWLLFLE